MLPPKGTTARVDRRQAREMDFTETDRLVLGRLLDDPELLSLLKSIDSTRAEFYLSELLHETQADSPNMNKIIQLASKFAERREGVQRYGIESKNR